MLVPSRASEAEPPPPPPRAARDSPQRPAAARPPAHLLMILHHPHRELRVAPEASALSRGVAHVVRSSSERPRHTGTQGRGPANAERRRRRSPLEELTLTRLRFRIGGRRGQEAGSGGAQGSLLA